MKVGRFTVDGEVRTGIIEEQTVYDVTDTTESFRDILSQLADGEAPEKTEVEHDVEAVNFLPPTTPENDTFAAALNYKSHIEETSTDIPERPLIFLKLYRSLVGHGEPISYHSKETSELDYEAELAAVIGKPTWNVDPAGAQDAIAGYTIFNDTSARDIQRLKVGEAENLDWFSGKAMEDTTPVGPYIVDANSVSDPHDLQIQSYVNDELMQNESTGLMIRGVDDLVSFISSRVRLQPGDIIATGTPEGVGAFQDVSLTDGDTVHISIEEIGELTNTVEEVRE